MTKEKLLEVLQYLADKGHGDDTVWELIDTILYRQL